MRSCHNGQHKSSLKVGKVMRVAGDIHMKLIYVAFSTAVNITTLSRIFRCSVVVDTLPYGSALLEESLVFMGSAED